MNKESTDLVRIHEAEIVEDMPFIPDSRVGYRKPGDILTQGGMTRDRHKSDEIRREERHKAKIEDALMIRERKIAVSNPEPWRKPKLNPMVEFYNNLLEELAREVEQSE